jgi:hypothetical protein
MKSILGNVIEEAKAAGWFDRDYREPQGNYSSALFLDPKFWQALGKARGWDEGKITTEEYSEVPADMWMWHFQWHRFIDHLAAGENAESFFAKLQP